MNRLPIFSIKGYERILKTLLRQEYYFHPISKMPSDMNKRVVYLRHDIDIHLNKIEPLIDIEKRLNCIATYFIRLNGLYNPLANDNRKVIQRIVSAGHEVGLHYDLRFYPLNSVLAHSTLENEVDILTKLAGTEIKSICMHEPHKFRPDPFQNHKYYINPYSKQYMKNMTYVSDSCRAWRDEKLLDFIRNPATDRLQLLIHPELWLMGKEKNRIRYLEKVIIKNALEPNLIFLKKTTKKLWKSHPGAIAHDVRESKRT